jgi:hypothetical protein
VPATPRPPSCNFIRHPMAGQYEPIPDRNLDPSGMFPFRAGCSRPHKEVQMNGSSQIEQKTSHLLMPRFSQLGKSALETGLLTMRLVDLPSAET